MKKIIAKVFVIFILGLFCELIFAASATCLAQNKNTDQTFSASGSGDTQIAASQDAENTVMQICKQGSSTPAECQLTSCSSSPY